ncbi:hypothetical protein [Streptosporangium vulgare]|uniref:hypothetical protein n=1 Tax=Streptosporangium vulgare TaxID=46190 RepID=UPI0031DA2481
MSIDQAQGVTSGGSGDCNSGGVTYFQPIDPILTTYGLTLKTTATPPWQGRANLHRLPAHRRGRAGRGRFRLPAAQSRLPLDRRRRPLRLPERQRQRRLRPLPAEVEQPELGHRRHLRGTDPQRKNHLHRHARLLPLPRGRLGRFRRLHPGIQGAVTRPSLMSCRFDLFPVRRAAEIRGPVASTERQEVRAGQGPDRRCPRPGPGMLRWTSPKSPPRGARLM